MLRTLAERLSSELDITIMFPLSLAMTRLIFTLESLTCLRGSRQRA